MAGDWIKFEVTTPDKPEVVKMSAVLGIDQDAVVGKLLRLWAWADQNSLDGNGVTVTSAFLDRLTFCPGFTAAMRQVGWLLGEDGDLSLPNFDRHNGKTAKERAVTNRRVSDHRKRSNGPVPENVTATPLQKPLPEKRREESKSNPPIPPADAGGKPGRKKSERITFLTFVSACRERGEKPIPANDSIFTFADDTLIPREYIAIAWRWFTTKHREGRKQQAGIVGWRAHFRDAVRSNWAKAWYFPGEGAPAQLTTVGIALKREMEAAADRKASDRSDAGAVA